MSNDIRNIKFETLIEDINTSIMNAEIYKIIDKNAFPKEKVNSFFSVISDTVGQSIIEQKDIEEIEIAIDDIEDKNIKKNMYRNLSMLLIYDYDKLNEYGKIILKESSLGLTEWENKYNENNLKNMRIKIKAAKEFIELCRIQDNKKYAYNFIFWSMMVMSVDKYDQENNLSLICDFARMLKISEGEILDILHVIKKIYRKEDKGYTFKTKEISQYFRGVLNLY